MERYTDEFKQLVEDSKVALAISLPMVLDSKATVKLKTGKGSKTEGVIDVKTTGNPVTQLFMLASATVDVLKHLEADREEGEEDIDIMAMFVSAMEIVDELGERVKK